MFQGDDHYQNLIFNINPFHGPHARWDKTKSIVDYHGIKSDVAKI